MFAMQKEMLNNLRLETSMRSNNTHFKKLKHSNSAALLMKKGKKKKVDRLQLIDAPLP